MLFGYRNVVGSMVTFKSDSNTIARIISCWSSEAVLYLLLIDYEGNLYTRDSSDVKMLSPEEKFFGEKLGLSRGR